MASIVGVFIGEPLGQNLAANSKVKARVLSIILSRYLLKVFNRIFDIWLASLHDGKHPTNHFVFDTIQGNQVGFALGHFSIVIIGAYDAASKTYPMRSFDNEGNFTIMQAKVEQEGVFQFTAERVRSRLTVSKDGEQMSARWEQSQDGVNWISWMDMNFTKVT